MDHPDGKILDLLGLLLGDARAVFWLQPPQTLLNHGDCGGGPSRLIRINGLLLRPRAPNVRLPQR